MKDLIKKDSIKDLLGELPLAAEMYWYLRPPGGPLSEKYSLERLQGLIPDWRRQAEQVLQFNTPDSPGFARRKVLVFGTLRYWVEHATLVGLALAGLGNNVTLAYLPYDYWQVPMNRFDLRRQDLYTRKVLSLASPLVKVTSFLDSGNKGKLPQPLASAVEDLSLRDTQYTMQVEEVDLESELYRMRLARNQLAALAALKWMQANHPDICVVPNGTILEFGAVYQAARYLDLPVVTYEFGEQRQRIWLAQNAEVMRQETEALWQVRKDLALREEELEQVRRLFASRQRASLWENFARRWQDVAGQGGAKAREALNLDSRPVVLLATNVIGDSLTLGRQVFSDTMTEWLQRTVQFFAQRSDIQLVIRIHPGELVTKGPSVADVVRRVLPDLPEWIHLIPADAAVNTYDLVEIAELGLVYTTTVGLEMAISGVPVIVVGKTHYRAKGFTLDPETWEAYFEQLAKALLSPARFRLTRQQTQQAWNYAYRFFFEYPHPFPWHLMHVWEDVEEWPLERVLGSEGAAVFSATFGYLVGKKVVW